MALRPVDVIEGARIDGVPNAYVLGCYDSRITFYSQQVRALELAHALHHQHLVSKRDRIAVIGGGAAGSTIAAALALQCETPVFLYERSDVLMPLQRASQHRRLDPHIYDWPRQDAEHELAELPMMDWRSGSAIDVRDAVCREFGEVRAAVGERLTVNLSHEATSVTPKEHGQGFDIAYLREGRDGGREEAHSEVEIVILAFGFGVEPLRGIPGTATDSYWSDAGVPGPEIGGNPRPRFFVSGNGDGGLIDLVAAASAHFDHHAMIRVIAHRRGVLAMSDRLLEIDRQARTEDLAGREFDFVAAYDEGIGADVAAMGLVDEVASRLRPGVQLYFQTREAALMSIRTATLNRLAVYLVIKACDRDPSRNFQHIVCADVLSLDASAHGERAPYLLECNGHRLAFDKVIVRRGPERDIVRERFFNLLSRYEASHRRWITRFPQDSIAPVLSDEARDHFVRLSRTFALPVPRYRQVDLQSELPNRVKVTVRNGIARWSGDLALANAADAWGQDARALQLHIEAVPDDLAALGFAIARLGIHGDRSTFFVGVARWKPFLQRLSCLSLHAEDLALPKLQATSDNASILNATDQALEEMAISLNVAMDRWVLDAIDHHLQGYLDVGDDPGRAVGFVAADDLRRAMGGVWVDWRQSFDRSPQTLARYLRLAVCAQDGIETEDEARVLVGPAKLKLLIRATSVALAIATGWQGLAPHGETPGNLVQTGEGTARTGHVCAAELIDGEMTAISAARFMWKTHFIVLPMIHSPIDVSLRANDLLIATHSDVPRLDEVDDGTNIIFTVDGAFVAAARDGHAELGEFLANAQDAHFRRWRAAIQESNEAGDAV